MYKFFVNNEQIVENNIVITGTDVNHIKNVLRIGAGEHIQICNKNQCKNYLCIVDNILNNEVKCKILEEILETTEANTYIHIFQGLPKTDKFEFIIEKCTEIGVKEITPVKMNRTITKLNNIDEIKKYDRWKKIAEVAAKQSKRDMLLKVNHLINYKDIFEITKNYDILIIAYENEKINTLKNLLQKYKNNRNDYKVAVIIGPEGGIADDEIELAKLNSYTSITLGNRILRTETAPLVISSNILYELEE